MATIAPGVTAVELLKRYEARAALRVSGYQLDRLVAMGRLREVVLYGRAKRYFRSEIDRILDVKSEPPV
jgi:hypothetical protein